MKLIKAFFIAFAMYSKVPVPQFEWKKEDMKYALCFFPFVGILIGVCMWGWWWLSGRRENTVLCFSLIGTAIPILFTGGFHIDGYMDTMDALHSYQEKERKLEILKDSHIGAFSVIMLLLYYLVYVAAFAELRSETKILIVGIGFILSRALSGIGVVCLRPAKEDGLLRTFSDGAEKKVVLWVLIGQVIFCIAGMLLLSIKTGAAAAIAAGGTFFYYRYRCYKEFGGITGDTAGWFVLLCEAAMAVVVAVL